MVEQKQFKSISIEQAAYEKLIQLAQRNYRSIPKELARLVNEAWTREQEREQCEEAALTRRSERGDGGVLFAGSELFKEKEE